MPRQRCGSFSEMSGVVAVLRVVVAGRGCAALLLFGGYYCGGFQPVQQEVSRWLAEMGLLDNW